MPEQFTIKEINKVKQGLYALILVDEGLDVSKLEVCADLLVAEGFYKGMTIQAPQLEMLKQKQLEMAVYHQAMRLLGGSDHFVQQMRVKLLQRNHDAEAIEITIDRLLEENLLNDKRTACQWVKNHQYKNSAFVMKEKLKAYHVKPHWIEEALSQIDVDAVDLINEKASKKWRQLTSSGREKDPKTGERLIAYLMRQGYDYPSCKRALTVLLAKASDREV